MYREPVQVKGEKSFRYKCGAYSQSSGAQCKHNHIQGPLAAEFVLKATRQLLLSPRIRSLVEQNLRDFAEADKVQVQHPNRLTRLKKEIADVQSKLGIVQRNLAYSSSKEEYDAISPHLAVLIQNEKLLQSELTELQTRVNSQVTTDESIADALQLFDNTAALIEKADNYTILRELFALIDARLFLKFTEVQWGKRLVRKPIGVVLTFGNVVPPVEIYQGRTGRNAIKDAMKNNQPHQRGEAEIMSADEKKSDSLGNVNRGDRI